MDSSTNYKPTAPFLLIYGKDIDTYVEWFHSEYQLRLCINKLPKECNVYQAIEIESCRDIDYKK